MLSSTRRTLVALLAVLTVAAGCSETSPVAPLAPTGPDRSLVGEPTLLACSTSTTASVSQQIGLLGGVLQLVDPSGAVHTLTFPLNAVPVLRVFTMSTLPNGAGVRVTATVPLLGIAVPLHFPPFAQPTLTVDYGACGGSVPEGPLHLYNVDETTGAVLEGPFGNRVPGTTTVSGQVPHFSDYMIGMP